MNRLENIIIKKFRDSRYTDLELNFKRTNIDQKREIGSATRVSLIRLSAIQINCLIKY